MNRELLPSEIDLRQPVRREQALVGEVVDREDAGNAAEHRMRPVERAEIYGRKAGLPVVRMDERRRRRTAAGEFERRADEERESPCVVGIVVVADAI